jgi:glycosyltransferase involved in cell wall biosynthesis
MGLDSTPVAAPTSIVRVAADRTVQLHFGRYVHPVYREQLHALPVGWRHASTHPALADTTAPTKLVIEQSARFARVRDRAETFALRALSEAGYVHATRASAVPGAALIHSAERLIVGSPLPYVLDFEQAELFVLYQPAALTRPWARALLRRALLDERLRFLLPWSDAARRSMLAVLDEATSARVAPKLRVVHPAIRPAVERPREPGRGPLRLLFVGTKFYEKGAVEAVEALRRVRSSYDVTLDVVSYVPEEWRKQLQGEPGLTLHAPGGADVVQRLYASADALLFPSHMDTYGWVVLEAMAHGLPVLAPDYMALPETVQDGVSGLLFPAENTLYGADARLRFRHVLPPPAAYLDALRNPSERYVAGIAEQVARLVEDRGLRERLGAGALASIATGKHSVSRRRALLAEIYAAAAG